MKLIFQGGVYQQESLAADISPVTQDRYQIVLPKCTVSHVSRQSGEGSNTGSG
eukprot:TRINITY_DN2778_c0_g1_i1.p2 TRINITY_DN2778_c0_g1~~TRINITY_DN2778_c0_g1_i1.p2  ORF type:complete len:53 (+),score=3.31 TRINITY_DN2778_c0_g1_i1:332-490(+)